MSSRRLGLSRKRKIQDVDETVIAAASIAPNSEPLTKSPTNVSPKTVANETADGPKPKKRISFKLKQLEGADLLKKEEFEAECRRLHTKDLIEEIAFFQKRIKSKQTEVDELRSVDTYSKLHNVDCLTQKYENWKKSCQLALEKLLESAREQHRSASSSSSNPLTMSDLLNDFQIPENLVDFDRESDSFA